jgi:uncharacterized membrane protein
MGEGAVNTFTIKNQYFNFLMFFIFNQMAEVAQEDKLIGDNPFSLLDTFNHQELISIRLCLLSMSLL